MLLLIFHFLPLYILYRATFAVAFRDIVSFKKNIVNNR